jgi:hypothetical protein
MKKLRGETIRSSIALWIVTGSGSRRLSRDLSRPRAAIRRKPTTDYRRDVPGADLRLQSEEAKKQIPGTKLCEDSLGVRGIDLMGSVRTFHSESQRAAAADAETA